MAQIHPTNNELKLLEMGYDRFLDLYEEIMSDHFWRKSPPYRLLKIKDMCAVYVELIKYPPINHALSSATRPHYKLVGKEFTAFLRNLLLHFPFFNKWSDIGFDKSFITTFESTGSIDRFLSRNHPEHVKFRFWESSKKQMTYVHINLGTKYSDGEYVWLRNIVPEREGVKFLCVFMRDVIMTQATNVNE